MRIVNLILIILLLVALLAIAAFIYLTYFSIQAVPITTSSNTLQQGKNLYMSTDRNFAVVLPKGWKSYEWSPAAGIRPPNTSVFGSLIGVPVSGPTEAAQKQQLIILWDASSGQAVPDENSAAVGIITRELSELTTQTSLLGAVNDMKKTVQGLLGNAFSISSEFEQSASDGTPTYFIKYVVSEGDKEIYGQSLFAIKDDKLYEVGWLNEKPLNSSLLRQIFESVQFP